MRDAVVGFSRALARKLASNSLTSWSKERIEVGGSRLYHPRAIPHKVVGRAQHIMECDVPYKAICALNVTTCSIGSEPPSYASSIGSRKCCKMGLSWISDLLGWTRITRSQVKVEIVGGGILALVRLGIAARFSARRPVSGCPRRAKPSEGARVFTIVNECETTIWPGIIPGDSFNGGGFALKRGQSVVIKAPVGWSGRIWGRTGCNFDGNGNGSCETGSCGSSLKCTGSGETPATLAEFTLAALDFYDVSLVDGFNLPVVVTPVNAQGGNCSTAGCDDDLRRTCPSELAVRANRKTVACRSACDVFNTDQYCCKGVYGNSATCQPTYYSKTFKAACPAAYSYAYDDPSSILTCNQGDYIITFCSHSYAFTPDRRAAREFGSDLYSGVFLLQFRVISSLGKAAEYESENVLLNHAVGRVLWTLLILWETHRRAHRRRPVMGDDDLIPLGLHVPFLS
ncbi:hypothetical protein BHM03_00004682 [Ensete ventricosum]|uniref:Thaumatin-like protein n=1 Tax=Ensete ventricosum TaxID=4639 RepID=A0A445MAN8_ENSVE|nr:hypothetical protein BHM03_00004682 [Ensete ventricosum]